MVVEYFETATSLWWVLVVAMCLLMTWAIMAKSIQGATFILLGCLGILIIFGDTMVYFRTLWQPMRIVYGCGIWLIGSVIWGTIRFIQANWKPDVKLVLMESLYWPFAGLAVLWGLLCDMVVALFKRITKKTEEPEKEDGDENTGVP